LQTFVDFCTLPFHDQSAIIVVDADGLLQQGLLEKEKRTKDREGIVDVVLISLITSRRGLNLRVGWHHRWTLCKSQGTTR